ncbi:potential E3 ubiquitin-protein ligase ariadne-1 [Drosophila novamexicana]|uniref:RBR-type E3 ubiquitin transferase n=1 Tax=Drosophila virilis TaxID=7244 RepID=B4M6M5_DROVI|nr:potential E3 ubiquitin-protein ligase ariadne-1 [Drosophila virilis]XP_015025490.1 potential E3 ubiquitin-protein ligase ariadne-1 [Drosophila virilis]XP_015025491.1 potential E3 ubiquitin-protein ligase ariadne-1 [Drosophila virilis]XP_030566804.1 potential E3 ubiquitin-protein ligase ariadne-1 [Drosophila novamexicana]XP_030566805.1 potential E3 ubiquitin-protein ligase ariadne-1 [Drosophila novamexicana]XP_030566806.1 potential E3 ubiquitin-protein ligase ariadne-1 [Drosophila novamexica
MDSDNDNDFLDNVDSGNVSSGDDGDDDFAMEVDMPSSTERQLDTDDYQYKVLTTDEIVQFQREIIDEVNRVLKLVTPITRILLNHFKWDKEKLLEKYFDGSDDNTEEFFKCAHVINPFNKPAETVQQKTTRSQCEECEICFSLLPPDSMTGLKCGHRFCLNCWREYLTTKIVTECLGQTISCAAHGCDILVDDVTVTKLVPDARVKVKYQQLITNSFVECNQLLRWCPSVDCTYAVKVPYAEPRRVHCKCGHVFCFACGENWHDPVQCRWLKKWIKKCDDDSETSNWIAANTKECPKCSVTIEKDGGCNHMVCKNQNCKHDFCWVCLGSWEPHGSSWYNCNRYDEDEAKAARDAQEKLRSSLARYLHYYNRYMNHMQSMKFENKLYASVKQKMEEMQQHNMSWIEVQFLKKAVDILCQCRQTLMYTYVFAYYLKKNNQSMIFEDNQKDLESATETLSEYLERDITSENLADIKQKVQDKYRYCEKRCTVLLKHVHEGYEKDWWDYTE